MKRLTTRQCYI